MLEHSHSYGVQGKVTISQKGSKQVFTLASLDFCSLVPDAGMGLKSARNKKMIVSAGIACPISARRSLSDGGFHTRSTSTGHFLCADGLSTSCVALSCVSASGFVSMHGCARRSKCLAANLTQLPVQQVAGMRERASRCEQLRAV